MLTEAEKAELLAQYNSPGGLIRLPLGKIQAATEFIAGEKNKWAKRFHPLVLINGNPKIGEGTKIGCFSEVYDKGSVVEIGPDCDIASFVAINCADSSERVRGAANAVMRKPIRIGRNVFIGSHCFIGGGMRIGDYCTIAAGTIIRGREIPDYSLVWGNPAKVKKGYYRGKEKRSAD